MREPTAGEIEQRARAIMEHIETTREQAGGRRAKKDAPLSAVIARVARLELLVERCLGETEKQ